MESLKNFEWYRAADGYRLAWLPSRGKRAYWIASPESSWLTPQKIDRSVKLNVFTTEYQGEKRVADSGIYVVGHRQTLNRRKPDDFLL